MATKKAAKAAKKSASQVGDLPAKLEEVIRGTAAAVEGLGGQWTSANVRNDELPPSGAFHFMLGGKRYLAVFQPLDMVDRVARP